MSDHLRSMHLHSGDNSTLTLINPLSLPSASFGKTHCFQLRTNGPGTPLGPRGPRAPVSPLVAA